MAILGAYSDFVKNYLQVRQYSPATVDGYWWVIKSLVKSLGDIKTQDITIDRIHEWIRYMESIGSTEATIASNIARLRVFIDYLNLRRLCKVKKDDIYLPKMPLVLPKYVRKEDVDRIIDFAGSIRDQAILSILFSTGLRNSELRNLLRGQVQDKTIIVRQGKGMRDRTVLMDERSKELLKRYDQSRVDKSSFLFTTRRGGQIAKSTLRYIVVNASKKCGLQAISPHQFRHGMASHLMKEGMPTKMIQELLGHQTIATTERHLHTDKRDIREKYDNIMQ